MATKAEKEKLMEVLKFTPRTYKIQMWGYGGEKVMGTVDRKIYDYFKSRRLDLMDYCWDSDYAEDNNIPEEMQPFPSGSWYEGDNMGHAGGVSRNAGTLQIDDENGETVFQKSFDDFDYEEGEPEWCCHDEVWIDSQPAGTVVFLGNSNEKGTFFEGEIHLKQPFDITKLELGYDDIDNEEIINRVSYDGEEIDNWGGSTDGKSSDFGFYIAHSLKDGRWEKYSNMDDIDYEMTPWFPKKIKPAYEGVYMVKTAGKNPYTYQCKWTGSKWVSSYIEPEDFDTADEIKIKEWQGLAADPDADVEWDAAAELQKIIDNFEVESHVTNTDNPVDFPQGGWPFAGPVETKETEVSESKTWTIRTHYKKSCEQHEYFYNREIDGAKIKVIDGYRSCEYTFDTEDGEFPDIQFTTVPGGDGKKDSIDLNSCFGSNVDNTELVEMFDGGCWGDTEIEGIDDDEEVDRLTELVSEEGSYALEEDGDGNWYLSDTEVWVWGPLEIEDEDGNVRIVCADADGNMIDYVEAE